MESKHKKYFQRRGAYKGAPVVYIGSARESNGTYRNPEGFAGAKRSGAFDPAAAAVLNPVRELPPTLDAAYGPPLSAKEREALVGKAFKTERERYWLSK